MSTILAAILGGVAAGVVALVAAIFLLRCFFIHIYKKNTTSATISSASESNSSSDLSLQDGQNIESSSRGLLHGLGMHQARCFTLKELNIATKNFTSSHLIGDGKFGQVYKGLLPDKIVAVKKRWASPNTQLVEEVGYLSSINHRNLVSLLGYCQENDLQMLVYEYIPNGSVSGHLYGESKNSSKTLEFKHRLSIALGAAKGLAHLHSLDPQFIHMDFKTVNVLVDENFASKIVDVGIRNLLDQIDDGGPSARSMEDDLFLDPEVKECGKFSEKSDVYSFGVFLLELVTGQEAIQFQFLDSGSIHQWAKTYQDSSDLSGLIDERMGTNFTEEGMRDFLRLTAWCLNRLGGVRPAMSLVVSELNRIKEKEISMTTIMGEGTPIVTLGSHLFTSST